jgi:hypothetical protein
MSARRLVFINHAGDAGRAAESTEYVVLDAAWTPPGGERPDVRSIRGALWEVIRERNLHDESLAALDAWATRADLVPRFEMDGVSWWAHVRGFVRLDLHELMLWRLVLDQLAPRGGYATIEVPVDRPHLRAALEAEGVGPAASAEIVVSDGGTQARRFGGGKPSRIRPAGPRPWYRRALSRTVRFGRRTLDIPARARARLLRERFGRLVRRRPEVLAIVRGESFHHIQGDDGVERSDPIVTPVLRRLEARGHATAVVILGRTDEGDDPRLLRRDGPMPFGVLSRLLIDGRERDDERGELARRLRGIEAFPLPVAGVDLAPAIVSVLASLDKWLARQRRERLVAERLIATLRPRVLVTGWESARTAWLAGARASGIPSVAIQHGVIYPSNPDYYRPVRPELVRPDLTCVFGAYERRLLVEDCAYAPNSVIATGSPRMSPAAEAPPPDPAARAAVRQALGVSEGERMLVISGARHAVGEGLHSTAIFARLLGGPLTGVHVVVKLHPEEEEVDHYSAMLAGLAAAGGYPAPPVTVVRDIDLYRLLLAADAHLGIYSTVLTDAVVVGTPNMVAIGQAWSDLLGYVDAGVAHPVASADDVAAFMHDPRPASPASRSAFLREHYEPGDGAERIADAVIRLAEPGRRPGNRQTAAPSNPLRPGGEEAQPHDPAPQPTLAREGGT